MQWTCKAKKEECQPSEQASSMDGKRKKAAAKERTVHGLEQQGRGRGRSIRGIKNDGSGCWLMLSRSPTTYLGMGDPRSVSISALNQKPPLWCCRRGVHPSSMAVALVPLPLSLSRPPTRSLALWRSFCCARWCRVWVWETDGAKRGRGIDCFYRQGGSGKKQQRRAEQGMWGGKSSLERSNRCDETWLACF